MNDAAAWRLVSFDNAFLLGRHDGPRPDSFFATISDATLAAVNTLSA